MIKQEINYYIEPVTTTYKNTSYPYPGHKKCTPDELEKLYKEANELGYKKGVQLQNTQVPSNRLYIVDIETDPTKYYYLGKEPAFIKCITLININNKNIKPSCFGYSVEELKSQYEITNDQQEKLINEPYIEIIPAQ